MGNPVTLGCEGRLDIAAAERLHEDLLAAAARGDEIALELGQVEAVSTAALQVLCAAVREARVHGRRFHLLHPSAPFLLAVRRLGLASALELDFGTETGGEGRGSAAMAFRPDGPPEL